MQVFSAQPAEDAANDASTTDTQQAYTTARTTTALDHLPHDVRACVAANALKWSVLQSLIDGADEDGTPTVAEHAASQFPDAARTAAAKKIISNHVALLKDVTNPAPSTQVELVRANRTDVGLVDLFLLEAARRLLGRRPTLEASLLNQVRKDRTEDLGFNLGSNV